MKSFVKSTALIFAIFAAITLGACKPSVSSNAPESFTVTYKTEHGTAPAAITVEQDTVLTQAQLPELTSTGYAFLGWYDADTKAEAGKYKVTKDVTLTAKWVTEDFLLPLTLEFIHTGTITIANPWSTLKYSKNGGKLIAYSGDITVDAGDKICLYAQESENTYSNRMTIGCSDNCYVYGNVMSLVTLNVQTGEWDPFATSVQENGFIALFQDNTGIMNHGVNDLYLPATKLATYCYQSMFRNCTGLTKAFALPAKTLVGHCYVWLYAGCTGLTEAPELPATNLAESCCSRMFENCAGLKKAPVLPATTLVQGAYYFMFSGCTSLTEVPSLPATTLAKNCYSGMFYDCTSLTKVPALPAKILTESCYNSMFHGCTSLTEAPSLPATTLAKSCYSSMFSGCTSLTTAPDLPATILANNCYRCMFLGCTNLTTAPVLSARIICEESYSYMFNNCSKLNWIECLATDISANNAAAYWLTNVASSGTFIKNKDMTAWTTGDSGIPSGWTVQDAQ